jgi:hypothetical protein
MALLTLVLIGAAQTAVPPSFGCAGSLSASEDAICGDAELAAWDRAIALWFKVGRTANSITVAQQRNWLLQREKCQSDKSCLRQTFTEWPGLHASSRWGQNFERPARNDTAGLEIAPIGGGWYAFSIEAIHLVVDRRGRFITANDGNADGVVLISAGRGRFEQDPSEDYSCRVNFLQQAGAWVLADDGSCGGIGVTMNGRYVPARKSNRK